MGKSTYTSDGNEFRQRRSPSDTQKSLKLIDEELKSMRLDPRWPDNIYTYLNWQKRQLEAEKKKIEKLELNEQIVAGLEELRYELPSKDVYSWSLDVFAAATLFTFRMSRDKDVLMRKLHGLGKNLFGKDTFNRRFMQFGNANEDTEKEVELAVAKTLRRIREAEALKSRASTYRRDNGNHSSFDGTQVGLTTTRRTTASRRRTRRSASEDLEMVRAFEDAFTEKDKREMREQLAADAKASQIKRPQQSSDRATLESAPTPVATVASPPAVKRPIVALETTIARSISEADTVGTDVTTKVAKPRKPCCIFW